MRLKRLTCRGFKSFADKTEFEFDSVLTGIIGPNGCGKSNVVDALKWVLGDQRARSLRGKEMTDVIFKGADGRDAMSMAEVRIELEDERGLLDGRTDISIGRRLTKDKESDYLLNGDVVRLKDVRSAMMDTGLGVGAYSVMEQGRIDAVLSANPEERRAIFEEAAGISKFKLQKRETLRRLERTEQNLARVVDLLEERGRRIRSLKIQAGKARRYAELRDRLRDYKAALAVTEAGELRQLAERRHDDLSERQQAVADLDARHAEAVEALAEVEALIGDESNAMEAVQERLRELKGGLEGLRHRAETLSDRRREQLSDAEACVARREALREQHQERQALLEEACERLEQLRAEDAELEQVLEDRRHTVSERQAELDALNQRRERARDAVLEWIHRKNRIRNLAHQEEAEIRAVRARERRLEERQAAVDRALAELEAQRSELEVRLIGLRIRVARVRADEERAHQELEAADAAAAALARDESALREQLSSVVGRKQVLADMESHMEGLDQGPRHLLETRPPGLRGRLLDLLEVDVEHGPALEAALGPLVQALVVDTRANADAILASLDEERRGRALLLIEEEFTTDFLREPVGDLPTDARPLCVVVRCKQSAWPMVSWLLRGVCLVPALDRARPERHDLCFVTPQGQLLCGPRVEGGRGEGQGGLVVRRALEKRLQQEETDLRARLDELLAGKRAVVERVERLKAAVRGVAVDLQELRAGEHRALGARERMIGRRVDLGREHEAVALERVEAHQHALAARVALAEHLMNEHLLARLEQREREAEAAATTELAAARERAREAQQEEQEIRLRQVRCRTDGEGLQSTIEVHRQGLEDNQRALEELVDREGEARAAAEKAGAEVEACQAEIGELSEQVEEVEEERERRGDALNAAKERRAADRDGLEQLDARRAELGEEVTALRIELSDLQHRFERLEDRLREEVGLELRRCLGEIEGFGLVSHDLPGPRPVPFDLPVLQGPPLPPEWVRAQTSLKRLWEQEDFDPREARKTAQVLQSQVDRLGHVNLDAVAELEEMEEGFAFLEAEVADLRESRKSLIETLRRLETESRDLFERTFEEARANFQVIFRKLFQGGKADMFLTEGEDSLESGIEIMARPPGKQLQSINLLSGGERSLTALAILFAVFQVKPSPFCILDEVDAALDETNVERFLRVLREFVGPTQFCIVTHHKRTMAECQKLYGITMQKRGISTRMAVALDEVDDFGNGNGVEHRDPLAQRIAGEETIGF